MVELERVAGNPEEALYYEIRDGGEEPAPIERYIVTTPQTRQICNEPELLGVAFNDSLVEAMTAAFRNAPFADLLRGRPEEKACIVNFLRGGLNFEIRRALQGAYGFNRQSSAFMSSQRKRVEGGWCVKEDMYRKLQIPKDAVLLVGDVVATGVTIENGFEVIADHVAEIGSSLRGLVMFTIGCGRAEEVLTHVDRLFRERFPDYERTVLVYLEARFHMVNDDSRLRIAIPGTDLIRLGALQAPEFAATVTANPAYALERCFIYDAGSRAFDIPTYILDVTEYWEQLLRLADDGWSLEDALLERWPDYAGHWAAGGGPEDRDAAALAALCRQRITTLRSAGGLPGATT